MNGISVLGVILELFIGLFAYSMLNNYRQFRGTEARRSIIIGYYFVMTLSAVGALACATMELWIK